MATFDTTIHECPDCGLFDQLVHSPAGTDQCCPRCAKVIRRVRFNPLDTALAWALAGLVFYVVAVTSPQLEVVLYGRSRLSTLAEGPFSLDDQGLWLLASLVLLTIILMPLIKLAGTTVVLTGLRLQKPPLWLAPLFGWLKQLNHWVMVEVYMLGLFIAYTRLQALMEVHLGVAAVALFGLMLSLIGVDAALDPEAVWEALAGAKPQPLLKPRDSSTAWYQREVMGCSVCHYVNVVGSGDHCVRCGSPIVARKPRSVSRSWALVVTAGFLYIPSNIFPIMSVTKFGKTQSYTIYEGMLELIRIGLWPLGVIVCIASIVIPCFKLVAMSSLLIHTQRRSIWHLYDYTRLYRLLDFIGRWSMIDVFMVAILVAIVRFGKLALVQADWGVVYFGAVVVLTMLAVNCFDPRLMWDNLKVPLATKPARDGRERTLL